MLPVQSRARLHRTNSEYSTRHYRLYVDGHKHPDSQSASLARITRT